MSDELRESEARLRAHLKVYKMHEHGSKSPYWTEDGWSFLQDEDVEKLAVAYLAETHSDDDLKLTIEEAEKEFGSFGHIDATVSRHKNLVAVKIDDWILLENRGDLRRLLSVLPPF